MKKEIVEGILSNPLFKFSSDDKKEKFRFDYEENRIKDFEIRENPYFCQILLEDYDIHFYSKYKDEMEKIVKEVIAKYAISTNFHKFFYSSQEDQDKFPKYVNNKQYNGKLMNDFVKKLLTLMNSYGDKKYYKVLFKIEIDRRVEEFKEEIVFKKYSDLKKKMEKIASGVSNEVYLLLDTQYDNFSYLNDELYDYIRNEYGYSKEKIEYSYSIIYDTTNSLDYLSKYICRDDNFNFSKFLRLVCKYNDLAHAKKILDYCFNEFRNEKYGSIILDNKFPLCFNENFLENLTDFAGDFTNRRVFKNYNVSISEEDKKSLLYPIYDCDKNMILEGKDIFSEFINKAFKDDSKKVLEVFNNLDNVVRNEKGEKIELRLRVFIESHIFSFLSDADEKKFAYLIYENMGTNENIYARFYFLISLMKKYCNEDVYSVLYEYLFDLIRMIEKNFNVTCNFTVNNDMREAKYAKLVDILNEFGLTPTKAFKEKYIISLLDLKYATVTESMYFAEFEMLGDSIYGMALSELIFFNKNEDVKQFYQQDLNKASDQIKVAKTIGIDSLYIANSSNLENGKYTIYDNENSIREKEHNYIADSLEMLIGVICKDLGLESAMKFAKDIIVKTYPELKGEELLTFEEAINSNIDNEYFNKIFYDLVDSSEIEHKEYSALKASLNKLLLTICLDTDTKEKRNFISQNYRWFNCFSYEQQTSIFVFYLYNGILKTIDVMKNRVISVYSNKKHY